MGITTQWDNDAKTIIRCIYAGSWEWSDMHRSIAEVKALMQSVAHTVDIIIDVTHSQVLPANPLTHLDNLHSLPREANAGQTILVGANMFVKRIYALFCRANPEMIVRFQVAATLDEARAILTRQPSLGRHVAGAS